jgi:hypothetical protein
LIKDLLHKSNDVVDNFGLNLNALNNYLFFYMFGFNNANLGNNSSLFKSQYRPMKKRSREYGTSSGYRSNRNAYRNKTTHPSLFPWRNTFLSNTLSWYKNWLCTGILVS